MREGIRRVLLGEWWRELRNIHGHPREVSSSLALGVFIGFTPTIGFQTVLCYGFSRILKKSFLVSFLGSCLVTGVPWLIPLVYYSEYWVGCKILGISPFHFIFSYHPTISYLLSLGKPLLLGSLLISFLGGGMAYGITYFILRIIRREK